jgi:lysylphosphatidylglycerol synthetase-like protein (DUF2156 family)
MYYYPDGAGKPSVMMVSLSVNFILFTPPLYKFTGNYSSKNIFSPDPVRQYFCLVPVMVVEIIVIELQIFPAAIVMPRFISTR